MQRSSSYPLLLCLVLAPALLLVTTPATALNLVSGELSANYWYAAPSGDLFHAGNGPANHLEDDLGLEEEGHAAFYARLGLPLLTYDGYTTRIVYRGKTQNDGDYGGSYTAGQSSELSIDISHAGVMINPLSLLEVVDIGLGLGLTAVQAEARAGPHEDSKDTLLLTGKAELRAHLPASPWIAALSLRSSDYIEDISAEIGYKLSATLVQVRAGYRHITFDDDRYEGTIAGPFAGLSMAF